MGLVCVLFVWCFFWDRLGGGEGVSANPGCVCSL